MIGLFTIVIALICLYLLSRKFITEIYQLLFRLTRSHSKSSYILAVLFLPGTFIHEMAHFLTALFLLVPVGELNLIPVIEERGIRMGSVKIGKTDVIRGSLIGIAPLVIGVSIILIVVSYAINTNKLDNPYIVTLALYLIFQITHTMFASKSDLKAVIEFSLFIILVVVILLTFNITEPFVYMIEVFESNREVIEKFSLFLFIPIFIEIFLLFILRLLHPR